MKKPKLLKLDFSHTTQDGFTKPSFPMMKIPWPIKDKSVEEISCLMRMQYVPSAERGKFMDEVYRVLIPDGKITLAVPYWTSKRSIQDYAHEWPPFCEESFLYFNKGWREVNHPDRKLTCNFEGIFSYQVDPEVASRADEARSFYIKHYNNTVNDMVVVLNKK